MSDEKPKGKVAQTVLKGDALRSAGGLASVFQVKPRFGDFTRHIDSPLTVSDLRTRVAHLEGEHLVCIVHAEEHEALNGWIAVQVEIYDRDTDRLLIMVHRGPDDSRPTNFVTHRDNPRSFRWLNSLVNQFKEVIGDRGSLWLGIDTVGEDWNL